MLAKSKLNSIETLISQALNDMEISHEEFIIMLKKKVKYEKIILLKLKMNKIKLRDWVVYINSKILLEIINTYK